MCAYRITLPRMKTTLTEVCMKRHEEYEVHNILCLQSTYELGKLRLLHNLNIRELEVSAKCTRAN